MFSHYFKITIRSILKQKGYSFINVVGLGIGMACSILILLWIQDELSYDLFHEKVENIYRLEEDQHQGEGVFHTSATPYPAAPVLEEEVPEIISSSRYDWLGETYVTVGDQSFNETGIAAVDPAFLEIFSYELLEGEKETALQDINSIILTKELSNKYFPDGNAVGKMISFNSSTQLMVTGVMQDPPKNSSYDFDALITIEYFKKNVRWSESWGNNSIRTFLLLVDNPDIKKVQDHMTDILVRNNEGTKTKFVLMPYKDLHLYSYGGFATSSNRPASLYIFGLVALFVLLIACINFMNLSTAKSAKRAKEIGMRKVIGAMRFGLIRQFLGESIIMSILGVVIALLLVAVLIDPFNEITRKEILFDRLLDTKFLVGIILITLFTGFVAGSYPALYLSSFRPIKVLKPSTDKSTKKSTFRRVLVVLQFTISITLIISTAIVFSQLDFMRKKNLGFDKEQVVYIPLKNELNKSYELIKNELSAIPSLENITGSKDRPGMYGSNSWGIDWDGKDPDKNYLVGYTIVDFNYFKTMDIKVKEGRAFNKDFSMDLAEDSLANFVINESMAKIMGGNPVGKKLEFVGVKGNIIGIAKDFHFVDISVEIGPLAMVCYPPLCSYIIAKLSPENVPNTIDEMETKWSSILPNYPFNYKFLDEEFDQRFRSEERMFELLKYFAAMAIIIACLGLFGLASYSAEQRTKEIGIRKTLGATELNLTALLCKEFVILVLISNLIAYPLSYYLMSNWLNEFAYRIDITAWVFLFSGAAALVVAVITVSFQAVKTSLQNPVNSLRYE
ncbi:MAG: ABC transporter permease [Melioribacteraceae bacterium]|nr:ABC transporter permease [Melioribacteraceae bacterium]MCF8356955.1 ABC transporter permease [Melioribacteraceae bacterium]MCF8395636.1 ABC transporter permease [Melioribacteraceae bacterium]MCF8420643.1 ABC transporter permease [Melioribacteraceae bacterium]